jgi:hypothetical protein
MADGELMASSRRRSLQVGRALISAATGAPIAVSVRSSAQEAA